jgi:hypothetical protein
MAWMASNIYLHTADPQVVGQALAELLASPAHAADPEGLLDAPPPLVVSPEHEGWIAVTGARAFFDDLPWLAAELSRRCRTPALSCELIGNSYALRLSSFEEGEPRDRQHTPRAAWTDSTAELAEMPLYEDAERLAFEALCAAGIPLPLAVLGTCPLSVPARRVISLGEGTSLRRPGPHPVSQTVEVRAPEIAGQDPPVLPSGTSHDFGLMLFEDRYVEGRPSLASVDRLLAIEEEILARARRASHGAHVRRTQADKAGAQHNRLGGALDAPRGPRAGGGVQRGGHGVRRAAGFRGRLSPRLSGRARPSSPTHRSWPCA